MFINADPINDSFGLGLFGCFADIIIKFPIHFWLFIWRIALFLCLPKFILLFLHLRASSDVRNVLDSDRFDNMAIVWAHPNASDQLIKILRHWCNICGRCHFYHFVCVFCRFYGNANGLGRCFNMQNSALRFDLNWVPSSSHIHTHTHIPQCDENLNHK